MAMTFEAFVADVAKNVGYSGNVNDLYNIPGFEHQMKSGAARVFSNYSPQIRGAGLDIAEKAVKEAAANPVNFVKSNMYSSISRNDEALLNSQVQYLLKNNVPVGDIQITFDSHVADINKKFQEANAPRKKTFLEKAFPVVIAFALPGIGSAIGAQLTAANLVTNTLIANAVGTAMASTALQMAQGADFDDALKNATVNAIIQTGAPSVATEINKLVKIPQVSDAITSAGASALKTAAAGGSAADIERNMIGAIAGSATSSVTGSNVAGAAAGGLVTGGVAGALIGASGALGTNANNEKTTDATVSGSSTDPGIQVAGGSDATALNMASISAKPEMLGKSGETASPLTSRIEDGQTVYERTITGKTPDGKSYSYTAVYDPSDKSIFYNIWNQDTNVATALRTRPEFSSTGTGNSYKPTIITAGNTGGVGGTGSTGGTTGGITNDQAIIDLISGSISTGGTAGSGGAAGAGGTGGTGSSTAGSTTGKTTGGTTGGTSSGTTGVTSGGGGTTGTGGTGGKGQVGIGSTSTPSKVTGNGTTGNVTSSVTGSSGGISNTTGTGIGTGTGGGGGTGTGTGGGGGTGTGTGDVLDSLDTVTVTGKDESGTDSTLVEDTNNPGKYIPNLFVYGGTRPSTLSQTLGTTVEKVPMPSTTTGTSVGLGGRGEIESKESGKKRKTVWNEESLRLKDALGL